MPKKTKRRKQRAAKGKKAKAKAAKAPKPQKTAAKPTKPAPKSRSPVIAIIIIVIAVVGYALYTQLKAPPKTDLDRLLDAFANIDEKYQGNWHEEKLNVTMMPPENIANALKEIAALASMVEGNASLENLLKARSAMLRAEDGWQRAEALKLPLQYEVVAGQVTINTTLTCEDNELMTEALGVYQLTLSAGQEAIQAFDSALQDSMEAREKIGVNENRPRFYESQIGRAWVISEVLKALLGRCERIGAGAGMVIAEDLPVIEASTIGEIPAPTS